MSSANTHAADDTLLKQANSQLEDDLESVTDNMEQLSVDSGLIPEEDINAKELKLKPFQVELAEPSMNGRNKIIIAPTNCGKTFVAMAIAQV